MSEPLYSLRMHSSLSGDHLSGAENLVSLGDLDEQTVRLVQRALQHSRGSADRVSLNIELIDPAELTRGTLPALRTLEVASVAESRDCAQALLSRVGVHDRVATAAIDALAEGAGPGGQSMRGAMLVDSRSGGRLEADPARGVRVSRLGMTAELAMKLGRRLARLGLDNVHVREALVLAGKVAMHPAVLAELCWSDDPDYTAGYVSSRQFGYLRFPRLKPAGETRGGRVFFLQPGGDPAELTDWLEQRPVLFDRCGTLHRPVAWRDYAAILGARTE